MEARAGTGGVTDLQVAFLVDGYLRDQRYSKTLLEFRAEASPVLAPLKSEAPMKMMTLSAILNDYIVLKEQALSLLQEKARTDHLFSGVKDLIMTYENAVSPPEAPIETPSAKRQLSLKPMLEITNTASGTKRIRHGFVLPSNASKLLNSKSDNPYTPVQPKRTPTQPASANKRRKLVPAALATSGPFSPPRQALLIDPHTPQQHQSFAPDQCTFQVPQTSLNRDEATPYLCSAKSRRSAATSCELPSKARSKRKLVKPTNSKCKSSLDFTTTPPVVDATSDRDKMEEKCLALDLPEFLSEDIFTPQPLSSLDDILGVSLDGSSFSDLMNSMMVDDVAPEINSPQQQQQQPDHSEIICLDDENSQAENTIPKQISRKNSGKENTPPNKSKR